MYPLQWLFPTNEDCDECGGQIWKCFEPTEPEIEGKSAKAFGRAGIVREKCRRCYEQSEERDS